MRKILISAVYFLSVGAFAQSKEQSKTWELLLNNKRVEARNFYDKNLKNNTTKDFENLFLDAMIDEEMGQMIFDETFIKNFAEFKLDDSYLYPIIKKSFLLADYENSGFDDNSYKKIDFLAQHPIYGESISVLEYKATLDRIRNNSKSADDYLSKIKRIDKWQFAGVFENLNGSGLYNEYEPETIATNDKLFNADSFGYVGWYNRKFPSNDGFEFFINETEYGRGIMYAQSFIENPVDRKILLEVDANTEFRLFLNDTEILSSTTDGYTNVGSHLVEVSLPKGMNRLLLKFDVKNAKSAFMVVPFDINYQKISDLKYFDTFKAYQKSLPEQLQAKELPLKFEKLLKENQTQERANYLLNNATPRLLAASRALYRLAQESTKPDAQRKAGFQQRDIPRYKAFVAGMERNLDVGVEKALDLHNLSKYAALPKKQRNADFDNAMGIKDGMSNEQLKSLIDSWYANSDLTDLAKRTALLDSTPQQFAQSNDAFVKAAVALYKTDLKREAQEEELAGKIQQAYASYMRAKIAFMQSKGQAVYPDANSTLRVTYGQVKGYKPSDAVVYEPISYLDGVIEKYVPGDYEFDVPKKLIDLYDKKDFGQYKDKTGDVPVGFTATNHTTGGNSGSPALDAYGNLVGLNFDRQWEGTMSDINYDPRFSRNIMVDTKYILFIIDKFADSKWLINEMKVVK